MNRIKILKIRLTEEEYKELLSKSVDTNISKYVRNCLFVDTKAKNRPQVVDTKSLAEKVEDGEATFIPEPDDDTPLTNDPNRPRMLNTSYHDKHGELVRQYTPIVTTTDL